MPAFSARCERGCGTVFKMTPVGTLTTLHSFCSQPGCAQTLTPDCCKPPTETSMARQEMAGPRPMAWSQSECGAGVVRRDAAHLRQGGSGRHYPWKQSDGRHQGHLQWHAGYVHRPLSTENPDHHACQFWLHTGYDHAEAWGCAALQTLSRQVIYAGRARNRTDLPFFLAASRARKNYLVAGFSHHRFLHEAMLSNTPSRIISACIMARRSVR